MEYPCINLNEISQYPIDSGQILDLIDNITEGVMGIDQHGKCTFCNQASLSLLGFSQPNKVVGQNLHHLIRHSTREGEAIDACDCEFIQVLKTKQAINGKTIWLWRNDGTGFPVELHAKPLFNCGVISGAVIAFFDISVRIQLQNELENTIDRYQLLMASSQVVPWEFDLLEQRFTLVSPQAEPMFGYDLAQWYTDCFWETHVHPDDQVAIEQCLNSCRYLPNFELSYRMLKSDGNVIYVKDFISVIYREDTPIALRGVFTDITTNKLQEEQLRLAMASFESPAAIYLTDCKGVVVKANAAYFELSGFSEQEVIDLPYYELFSKKHGADFYQRMRQDLNTHGRWQGEVWHVRKDKKQRPDWLTVTTVKNMLGETTNFVAMVTDISKIKKVQKKLKFQIHYDSLTKLPNKKLLCTHIQRSLTQAGQTGHCGALILIDLNKFSEINDTAGHEVGDFLLRHTATIIRSLTSEGDLISRIGSDEFAILLPDLGGDRDQGILYSQELTQKVCNELEKNINVQGADVHLTASAGITLFSGEGADANNVIQQADIALSKARKAKNLTQIIHFHHEMHLEAHKRLSIQSELKRAIDCDELMLHFQPQFDQNHNLSGLEVLVRWCHPTKGVVPPNDFIPIAEESGLIIPLGRWVLERACIQYAYWQSITPNDLPRISVNFSTQQFLQSTVIDMVLECLQTTSLSPECLDIEITEQAFIEDIDSTIKTMHALKQNGITFSIDDFGTGYSSLAYLKKLPIDYLKIDRSFVVDLPEDKDGAVIADTIIAMAKHLGLKVIAEGVERVEQVKFLTERDCDYFQGFYFSTPLAAEQFQALFIDSSESKTYN